MLADLLRCRERDAEWPATLVEFASQLDSRPVPPNALGELIDRMGKKSPD
jgi:hypothetical protein